MPVEKFFKLFPPPKFLDVPCAGLDISEDAIRCIEYARSSHGLSIRRFGSKALPPGVIEAGEIKNDQALVEALSALAKELKVFVVKASLPEEKLYRFKTEVPSVEIKEMRQNIESKLEEHVPLTAAESLFFFDLIPKESGILIKEGGNPIGVSVAPLTLVESYLEVIKAAGITVLSFEVNAKGIARAVVPQGGTTTDLIVHVTNKSTGLYIVVGGVVCFTSTVALGDAAFGALSDPKTKFQELRKSILQVFSYWNEHGLGTQIERVVFVGKGSLTDGLISECSTGLGVDPKVRFEVGKVWQNAFSHDSYIPPISYEDSLDYAVAAGLALP